MDGGAEKEAGYWVGYPDEEIAKGWGGQSPTPKENSAYTKDGIREVEGTPGKGRRLGREDGQTNVVLEYDKWGGGSGLVGGKKKTQRGEVSIRTKALRGKGDIGVKKGKRKGRQGKKGLKK